MHYKVVARNRWQRISDLLLCVFGVLVMGYTTALTVISWTNGSGQPKAPGYCDESKFL